VLAAFRSAFLGAAIFAGAAVVAGMLAIMLWVPLRPDHDLGDWLWFVVRAGISAAISAALSFVLLKWLGWRLSRRPLLARAALLGSAAVLGSHLLVGLVFALLFLPESFVQPHWRFDFTSDIVWTSVMVSFFSAFWIFVTLPLGVATAFLVESLEARLMAGSAGDQAEAVE
jgi:hypothetical protein